jgi:phthalate 4,5-dioxygenase oxygenase subunit
VKFKPGTYDPLAENANDYLMDRGAQRRKESFSGIAGIAAQDFSLQESMGVVADRTKERLGTSDAGIILARRRLLATLDDIEADDLPGLDPEHTNVRSTSILLARDVPFQEGAKEALVVTPGANFHSI